MKKVWWKESIVYQIYPRSFYDSNHDGIGDIQGIIQKLDYIESLGIDVIWLCPVYDSPNDDNGYDIRDYHSIMQEFGTMADFDELLNLVHKRGMKLIMDLVVNHTSDEHAWFVESRSSKENDKRDFYIWKDGENGNLPNNWESFFGGSTWEHDQNIDQYYLHLFTKKQPDLNWENERVRDEVHKMMNWWMDKGIDGFRMDVISLISKRDFEDSPYQHLNETIEKKYANGPKVTTYLEEMVKKTIKNYDVMTVGEGPGITFDRVLDYVDERKPRLNMIFHFDHMFIDHGPEGKFYPVDYDFKTFKNVFTKWDKIVEKGGWPAIFLGNHDFPRIASRFGNDSTEYHNLSVKALSLVLLTLRGTTYIYQGDEIGMTNLPFDDINEYRDVEITNAYKELIENGGDERAFFEGVKAQGRDNARSPLQWSGDVNGGFSETEPWIKPNPNFERINVGRQENDPNSVLNFYRKAIKIRKQNSTLVYGDFETLDKDHLSVFAYRRKDENGEFFVVVNFSESKVLFSLGEVFDGESILSNYQSPANKEGTSFSLRPWEGFLMRVS